MSGALEVLDKIRQRSIFWLWPWSNYCFKRKCSKRKGNIKKINITRQLHIHWRPHSLWLHCLYYLWTFPEILYLSVCYSSCCFTFPVLGLVLSWHLKSLSYPPLVSTSWEKEKEIFFLEFFITVNNHCTSCCVLFFVFFTPHILLPNCRPSLFHSPIPENTFLFPQLPAQFKPSFLKDALIGLSASSSPFSLVHFIYDPQIMFLK